MINFAKFNWLSSFGSTNALLCFLWGRQWNLFSPLVLPWHFTIYSYNLITDSLKMKIKWFVLFCFFLYYTTVSFGCLPQCFPPGWWEQIRWRGPITRCQETHSVTKQVEEGAGKRGRKEKNTFPKTKWCPHENNTYLQNNSILENKREAIGN